MPKQVMYDIYNLYIVHFYNISFVYILYTKTYIYIDYL